MKNDFSQKRFPSDTAIAFVVLAFLLIYTYGLLFLAPYLGFYFNPTHGRVSAIFLPEDSPTPLRLGDVIDSIGGISFDEYLRNRNIHFLQGLHTGQTIELIVERDGKRLAIPWVYPGVNQEEFLGRFFNIWWLAYVFWFVGLSAKFHIRPRDTQWRLFVASAYLMAMFVMLGSVSSYSILMSSILMRAVAWLMLPVYLHFHWIFPQPFRRLPRWFTTSFYVLAGGFVLGELFQLTPRSFYFLAVILAFGGSILLLILHYILHPDYRNEVRLLAIAAVLALLPIIGISIVSGLGNTPDVAPLVLLFMPILPAAYFYVLYRRNLGGLELRANRIVSIYTFLILLGLVLILSIGLLGVIDISREEMILGGLIICLSTAFAGIQFFPVFQSWVEKRLLGIKLPTKNMVESYSARIVTSTSIHGLLKLLEDEVFPSLLIRQYAFVETANPSTRSMLCRDVDPNQVQGDALLDFVASAPVGQLIPLSASHLPFEWVRLILPLRVGSELIGAWLLGRRDPDDHYPQAELPILQSLANQTAVALSNIIQTERLKVMYEANINRYEQERLRLAHDLHDSLLNEMAAMLMKSDPGSLPQDFQESFDGLIVRLREIVTDLRPALLIYGLKSALDGLADNLSERNHDSMQIRSEVQAMDECRYPEIVEQNIYRIVQEACENALKYAQASSIKITGELTFDQIDIQVVDDGIGLSDAVRLRLSDMVANKHYGLAGMHERADLIGATIRIDSASNRGTHIHVRWKTATV